MNVNQRELNMHVEYESDTYFAAFSCELEACAYPMWALISHLKDANTASLTRRVLSACVNALLDWFRAINFTSPSVVSIIKLLVVFFTILFIGNNFKKKVVAS